MSNQTRTDNIPIKSNTIFQTKILTEIAVFSALSAVLYSIRIPILLWGASITLASMVPIMWLSLRR
ncbi:MAG TPA: hypothetical protein VK253_08730, partial [Candidatus Binatia bacterium]|nr:hypothetical protein [Candidatus Binatia bacterium]